MSSSHSVPEREVDLSQLFSDVSRTVSGIRSILSQGPAPQASAQMPNDYRPPSSDAPQADSPSSPLASLFGSSSGVCFKTCGMEDIQFAARRAGEMLMTMRVCMIVLTAVAVFCALALTIALVLYLYKSRNAFENLRTFSENSSLGSGTPLISHANNPREPIYVSTKRVSERPPPPPIPLPKQLASSTTITAVNQESS